MRNSFFRSSFFFKFFFFLVFKFLYWPAISDRPELFSFFFFFFLSIHEPVGFVVIRRLGWSLTSVAPGSQQQRSFGSSSFVYYYSNSFTVVPKRRKKENKKEDTHYQKSLSGSGASDSFGCWGSHPPGQDKHKQNSRAHLSVSSFFLLWPPTPHGTCFLLLSVGELNPIKETIKAHTIRRRNNTVRWRIPLMHHQMQHTGCVCVCAIKVYSLSRLCQQEKRIKRMCIHTGGYKVIA